MWSVVFMVLCAFCVGCSGASSPGPTAGGDGGSGSASSSSGGGSCLAVGIDCTNARDACCSGLCDQPTTTTGPAVCAAPCTTGADCNSGCCASLQNTAQMACSPIGFCANTCHSGGGACAASTDCCLNYECVTTNGGTCAATCTSDSQCQSGCCAPLSTGGSVCSAVQFCQ